MPYVLAADCSKRLRLFRAAVLVDVAPVLVVTVSTDVVARTVGVVVVVITSVVVVVVVDIGVVVVVVAAMVIAVMAPVRVVGPVEKEIVVAVIAVDFRAKAIAVVVAVIVGIFDIAGGHIRKDSCASCELTVQEASPSPMARPADTQHFVGPCAHA